MLENWQATPAQKDYHEWLMTQARMRTTLRPFSLTWLAA
jgi:hypothetical protein